jgi:hypothetical protein
MERWFAEITNKWIRRAPTAASKRLFAFEGVVAGGVGSACWGRGLPMMGVLTLPIWKTSTWVTLVSLVPI